MLTNKVIEMSAINTRACFVKPRGTNRTLYPWLRIIPVVIPIVALTYPTCCLDHPVMIQDGHEVFLWICVDILSTVNSESDLKLRDCFHFCALLDVID